MSLSIRTTPSYASSFISRSAFRSQAHLHDRTRWHEGIWIWEGERSRYSLCQSGQLNSARSRRTWSCMAWIWHLNRVGLRSILLCADCSRHLDRSGLGRILLRIARILHLIVTRSRGTILCMVAGGLRSHVLRITHKCVCRCQVEDW